MNGKATLGGLSSHPGDSRDSATAVLAKFVSGLRTEDIPSEVLAHVRVCLLDTLGCGLYGSTLPWTQILLDTLLEIDKAGDTPVWGTTARLNPVHAALVNGAAVHSFELDDLHKLAIVHPGSVVLPAVLSAAQHIGSISGARVLTAMIAGYEVAARVGMSMGTAHLLQGWHPTGTHGTLGAAAAASHVLGLDAIQTQNALGIAGTQSSGLMAAQFSSMVKRFHAGRAAQSGLYGALLARRGYTGITDLFESDYGGYCTTFSPKHDADLLVRGLGSEWETLQVGFKPYSTNGSCHPTIDALKDLLADKTFTVDDVDKVKISVSTATKKHVGWNYMPDSVTTAQMNLSYICAVVLTDGEAFVDQFSAERIIDPRLIELSRRIEVLADESIDRRGDAFRHATRLEVYLRDGRILREAREFSRGSPGAPVTDEELRAKYRRLAEKALTPQRATRLEEIVERLDQLIDINELVEMLVGDPKEVVEL